MYIRHEWLDTSKRENCGGKTTEFQFEVWLYALEKLMMDIQAWYMLFVNDVECSSKIVVKGFLVKWINTNYMDRWRS